MKRVRVYSNNNLPGIKRKKIDIEKQLIEAVKAGKTDLAKSLIDKGANLRESEDEDQNTALHCAVRNNDIEMCKILADYNIDYDARNSDNKMPIHFAIKENNIEIMDFLYQHDANFEVKPNGFGILHYAVSKEVSASEETLTYIINNTSHVDRKNYDGVTPLHIASSLGNVLHVKILLSEYANPNFTTLGNRFSPIHYAAKNGHSEIVKMLLDYDANIHQMSKKGETPLFIAVERGNIDVVKLLLSRGYKDALPEGFSNLSKMANFDIKKLLDDHAKNVLKLNNDSDRSDCLVSPSMSLSDESLCESDIETLGATSQADIHME